MEAQEISFAMINFYFIECHYKAQEETGAPAERSTRPPPLLDINHKSKGVPVATPAPFIFSAVSGVLCSFAWCGWRVGPCLFVCLLTLESGNEE